MGVNDKRVFPDEPPISDYPLCIINRQIAASLGQNIAEKSTACIMAPYMCVCGIGGMTFMLVKKGKLNIILYQNTTFHPKLCAYNYQILSKSINIARNHRFTSNLEPN